MKKLVRVPLLLGVVGALVGGLYGALQLIAAVPQTGSFAAVHGPLMVFGFVGTAIALERAVASQRGWALLAPGLLACGSLVALLGEPIAAGSLWAAGFLWLGAVYVALLGRHRTPALYGQAAGAAMAFFAAVSWAIAGDFEVILPLAAVFVICTIVGERLELARLRMAAQEGRIASFLVLLCAVALTANRPLVGVLLIVLAVVMARVDVAVVLIRQRGLPRYSAAAMLVGYAWLAVAGVVWVCDGSYDAAVHAVFLGFVISMIMAHAPIIVASVLKISVSYYPILWLPLVALHAGLVVRVWLSPAGGGLAGVVTLAVFVLLQGTAFATVGRRR